MPDQMHFAVVGCGVLGARHARHAAELKDVKVTHVVDPDDQKAKALAGEIGAKTAESLDEVLQHDIDGVILAVPHTLHREYATAALKAGKSVMLEKPIASSLDDAESIAQAAGSAAGILLVAHVLRFYPAHLYVHRIIQEGSLGRLFQLRYHAEHHTDLSARRWVANKEEGGVIVGGGIHHTDLLAWWGGAVRAVRGYGSSVTPLYREQGTHDHGQIIYEFENGAFGVSCYSLATHSHGMDADQAVLSFEHGTLRIGLSGRAQLTCEREVLDLKPGFHELALDNDWENGLRSEMIHFRDAIRGEPLRITPEEAVYALRIAHSAKNSAEADEMGKRIEVTRHFPAPPSAV